MSFYMPFDPQRQLIQKMIMEAIKSDGFKAELSNYIRLEVEASKTRYASENNKNSMSYEMLTRGNVNMQARMAANGYDVYGRTIISSNSSNGSNKNVYQKMKNKINYGANPTDSYTNRGSYSIVK